MTTLDVTAWIVYFAGALVTVLDAFKGPWKDMRKPGIAFAVGKGAACLVLFFIWPLLWLALAMRRLYNFISEDE